MKIALITSEFPPMNAAAAARTGPWADELEDRGHEVAVLTSREAVGKRDPRVLTSRFGVPSNRAGLVKRFWQEVQLGRDLGRLLGTLNPKPDLVVITSPPFFMARLCSKAAKHRDIPYVLDVRDRYPAVLFDLGVVSSGGLAGRTLRWMERSLYAGARLVTTVTHGLTRDLKEVAGAGKVVKVINGFDGRAFTEENLRRPKREMFTVAYHGRLGRFYEVETLRRLVLETKKLDAEIRFVLAGDLEEARASGDWGGAEFLRELSLGRLAKLLAECHLGVCLLKETKAMRRALPAKVFDFLGAGLPVLASPSGELATFISKREVGLTFDRTDPEAIATAIVSLKNEPERRESMAANARALRSELDRRVQACPLVELIEAHQ